jgi:hypothetical protein
MTPEWVGKTPSSMEHAHSVHGGLAVVALGVGDAGAGIGGRVYETGSDVRVAFGSVAGPGPGESVTREALAYLQIAVPDRKTRMDITANEAIRLQLGRGLVELRASVLDGGPLSGRWRFVYDRTTLAGCSERSAGRRIERNISRGIQ